MYAAVSSSGEAKVKMCQQSDWWTNEGYQADGTRSLIAPHHLH